MNKEIDEIRDLIRNKEDLSYEIADKICDVLASLNEEVKYLQGEIKFMKR